MNPVVGSWSFVVGPLASAVNHDFSHLAQHPCEFVPAYNKEKYQAND
jgi:hypothetical protein